MTTGDTIREIRTKRGITQIELAQAAEIAVNSLRLYEQGKRYPKAPALQRIADALGVPVSSLRPSFTELWDGTIYAPQQGESRYMRELKGIASELIETEASLLQFFLVNKLNRDGQLEAYRLILELAKDPRYRREDKQSDTPKSDAE